MDSSENKIEVELTATEKLAQFEKAKLSRRQALARIGFQAGAAAIATLTADDLLRKVGKEMQRRAGDNKVVEQVAKEFQHAGVANAVPPTVPVCPEDEEWDSESSFCLGANCDKCAEIRDQWLSVGGPGGPGVCWSLYPNDPVARYDCQKGAQTKWCNCMQKNNCPGKPAGNCSNCTATGC